MRTGRRHLEELLGAALLRDDALVALAVGLVGASYGAITASEGFPVWAPTLMSMLVFAGASQFLVTGVVGAGTFADGREYADPARPLGSARRRVLAWREAPFALVVVSAAATAALARLLVS